MPCDRGKKGDPGGPPLHPREVRANVVAKGKNPQFLSTGKTGKPQLVRINQRMYDTLPMDAQNFVGHNYAIAFVDAIAVAQIVQIRVPENLVLDISELRFRFLQPVAGLITAMQDYAYFPDISFRVDVNGVNPWDQFSIFPGVAIPQRQGWSTANQNVMASWSDTPVHLVVQQNDAIDLSYEVFALTGAPAGSFIIAELRGRWIPYQLWSRLVEDNR